MNRLEHALRESLKHKDPPANFADKVLARAEASEQHVRTWRWMAVAALVLFMVGGGYLVQEYRRQIQAEQSKEQLLTALRITESKMRRVEERLSELQQRTIELRLEQ